MFQRTGPAAYKEGLGNTLKLDKLYDHPHKKYKTIHVAGTNGKGSVSHMLASVLQSSGYKTGLYTSPHLKDFRERIKINGEMISKDYVANWISNFEEINENEQLCPSFFELTNAMAFNYFAEEKVDIAVIEVGLGGRLDSTNIISPEISIITNIGWDHTNLLGNTLDKIATEKAGIIKPNTPVVIGSTQPETKKVFIKKAKENNSDIFFADQEYQVAYSLLGTDGLKRLKIEKKGKTVYSDLKIDLLGNYQHKNILAVLKAVDLLNEKNLTISEKQIRQGLEKIKEQTGLLGRWQIIGNNPLTICDTGHNEDGICSIVKQIKNTPHKDLHFVFGTVGDKDPTKVLALLPQKATYYFVKANIDRAMEAHKLQKAAEKFKLKGKTYSSVKEGLNAAQNTANKEDIIFIGGSTFVVSEVI
jgi:dihydrofolate synthase/folylpolyglutamate synthase